MTEHSGSAHTKSDSVAAFSSHSQARTDRLIKRFPLRKACTTWFRAVSKFEKAVSHNGHTLEIVIVVTCSFNPCVPPPNKKRALHAPVFTWCVSKKFRALLAIFCPASTPPCVVRLFLRNLFEFSDCSWGGHVVLQCLRSNHI